MLPCLGGLGQLAGRSLACTAKQTTGVVKVYVCAKSATVKSVAKSSQGSEPG